MRPQTRQRVRKGIHIGVNEAMEGHFTRLTVRADRAVERKESVNAADPNEKWSPFRRRRRSSSLSSLAGSTNPLPSSYHVRSTDRQSLLLTRAVRRADGPKDATM